MSKEAIGTYEMITADRAKHMLKGNVANRPMSRVVVDDYSETMSRGEWGRTDQPIIVDRSGALVDGQHRLAAVVQSGRPQVFLVIHGADREQFKYIDRHKRRGSSDLLAIAGDENTVALAACLSWIDAYERRGVARRRANVGSDQLVSLRARWPESRDSVKAFAAVRGNSWMKTQAIAAVHALASRFFGRGWADDFLSDLATGTGMQKGDPVWLLRELLINDAARRSRFPKDHIFRLALKAANLRARGRTLSQLTIRSTEAFPVLDGDTEEAGR